MDTTSRKTQTPKSIAPTSVAPPVVFALTAVYCILLLVRRSPDWPGWLVRVSQDASGLAHAVARGTLSLAGIESASPLVRYAVYLAWTAGIVPLVVSLVLCRGRLERVGFRRPNRLAGRILLVGYGISLPFLLWMASSPSMAKGYLDQWRQGAEAFLVFYFVNMLVEHFFLHGAVLAWFRSGFRWPDPVPCRVDSDRAGVRVLQWMGMAQTVQPEESTTRSPESSGEVNVPSGTGAGGDAERAGCTTFPARVGRWLGLPGGCLFPIGASALLFAGVHLGKDPHELVLSLPGGAALAYIAYRTNTWLVPFALHVLTAGTTFVLMLLLQSG